MYYEIYDTMVSFEEIKLNSIIANGDETGARGHTKRSNKISLLTKDKNNTDPNQEQRVDRRPSEEEG